MKKISKKCLSVLLCVAIILGSAYVGLGEVDFSKISIKGMGIKTHAASESDLEFTDNGDGYTVTHCKMSASGHLDIPSTYRGKPVTAIGNRAFVECTKLTSITIPSTVTSIGYRAFWRCISITSITIPQGVTSIGVEAFCNCNGLDSIIISDSVTSIGVAAFWNTSYYNNENNWENNILYIGNHLIEGQSAMIEQYVIKDGTKVIADNAFESFQEMTYLRIPGSVTTIGDYAFNDCSGLTDLTIPGSVTTIGDYAFNDCSGLTGLTIPDGVISIGDWAFMGCEKLKSVTIPDSIVSLGCSAFGNCPALEAVYITDIAAWCNISFVNCSSNPLYYAGNLYVNGELFEVFNISDDITDIASYAFYNCSNLSSVVVHKNVRNIGTSAFAECRKLSSVTFDYERNFGRLDNIGNYAFSGCESLKKIIIPNPVLNIGIGAFSDCSGLVEVELSEASGIINELTFYNCTSLISINVPHSNVECIGKNAFKGCSALVNAYIGYKVKTISSGAFEDCSSLTSVYFGDDLKNIEYGAFKDCENLKYSFYIGSEAEWSEVTIAGENTYLTDAVMHYNSTDHDYIDPTGFDCVNYQTKYFPCTVCGETVLKNTPSTGHYFVNGVCLHCSGTLKENAVSVVDMVVLESAHSYENNTNETKVFECPGAEYIEVRFSSLTEVEFGYDNIYIYDGSDTLLGTYTGFALSSRTIRVDDDTVKIKLTSDGNATRYGYDAVCRAYGKLDCSDHLHRKEINSSKPGCENDGYSGDTLCAVCEEVIWIGSVEPAHGHEYSTQWTIDDEANCIKDGSKSHHCKYCGDKKDITVIPARGHEYDDWIVFTQPTCAGEGLRRKSCVYCGFDMEEVIPAIGHKYSEWDVIKEPTCIKNGSQTKTCSTCGDVVREKIPEQGHNYSDWTVTEQATCTNPGSQYRVCSVCDCVETEIIPVTGHSYGDWAVTLQPTCTKTGTKSRACTTCNYAEKEKIFPTGHSYGDWIITNHPTCTQSGSRSKTCSAYADVVVEVIVATGHICEWVKDTTNLTKTGTCSICGNVVNEAMAAIDAVTITLNNDGKGYTITDCPANYSGEVIIPETYSGLPITAIGKDAFRSCTKITSVVIPNSVTSIGGSAFRACTNLKSIDLPDNITSIPGSLCYDCKKLESVDIPSGVTKLGGYAFINCTALKTATIPGGIIDIGYGVFKNCNSMVAFCKENSLVQSYLDSYNNAYIVNAGATNTDISGEMICTEILGGDLDSIFLSASSNVTCSTDTSNAATGAIVSIRKDNTLHSQYTLVVDGDTNADSICDVLDCFDVERTINGNAELSGAYAMAGNSNGDDVIDIYDYQAIVNKSIS